MSSDAAQLDAEAVAARLRSGAEAPRSAVPGRRHAACSSPLGSANLIGGKQRAARTSGRGRRPRSLASGPLGRPISLRRLTYQPPDFLDRPSACRQGYNSVSRKLAPFGFAYETNDMMVIKAGGNAIWPRAAAGIDQQFLTCLLALVQHLIKREGETVVLVPGGVGGQFFISWAREAGCSDAEMNDVGCTLINTAAIILSRYFTKRSQDSFRTCPVVAETLADLHIYSQSYEFVVAGVAVPGAVTSDSLAALIAEHFGAKLIILKSRYPYETEHLEFARDGNRYISNRAIAAHIARINAPFTAGHHASLDYVCLRVLERAGLEAQILSSADLAAWCDGGPLNKLTIVE